MEEEGLLKVVKPRACCLPSSQTFASSMKPKMDWKENARLSLKNQYRVISSFVLIGTGTGKRPLIFDEFKNMTYSEILQLLDDLNSKFPTGKVTAILNKAVKASEAYQHSRFLRNSRIPRLEKLIAAYHVKLEHLKSEVEFYSQELKKALEEKDKKVAISALARQQDNFLAQLPIIRKLNKLSLQLIGAKLTEVHLGLADNGFRDIEFVGKTLRSIALERVTTPLIEKFERSLNLFFERLLNLVALFQLNSTPPPKLPIVKIPQIKPRSPNLAA
jgi:hypothetical protein